MNQSMPRFENQDSLERFLGNMKLQIFNAEFADLCKISPDSMKQLFDDSSKEFEKNNKKVHQSPKTVPRTAQQLLQIVNPRSVLTKRRNSDFDIEKEISLQSEFKIKKQESNQFNQKPLDDSSKNLSIPAPVTGMYSEESKVDLQQSPKQNLNTPDNEQNSQEKNMKLEETENSQMTPQPVPQQSLGGGVPGRTKFIQPIYVVFPNQTYGYVEVDVMDENAMKNISMFLQYQQYQQQQQQPQ